MLLVRVHRNVLILLLVFSVHGSFGQMGKDGSETVSSANVIFNRYDQLAATANAGSLTITVSNINNLSASAIAGAANNPYTTNVLHTGDLLMIIKMQGATITSGNVANSPVNSNPPHTDVYGKITAYNGVGSYELCMVKTVSGNTITFYYPLMNAYVVGGTQRVQVVRVPRLSSLTVNSGASITGLAWGSGFTGGIIALEVAGSAVINGSISATGIGFRGGAVLTTPKPLGGQFNQYDFVGNDLNYGGEKGESIAGSQADYDTYYGGRYKRGAPANGGGGGNSNCAGGGGGANAGISSADTSNYNGWGVPDAGPSGWSIAWNLETPITGLSHSNPSSGGGRGGYSFSGSSRNPLTLAPGGNNWGGDKRKVGGGWGGRPLLYSGNNVLFMGGGGGAGDADDQAGGSGGNGGGIIYMTVTGSISGSGTIVADGDPGENTTNRSNPYNAALTGRDAAGGGGGGGAIRLNVQINITGVSISAKGGNGGNQLITATQNSETEGPGGGGYVACTGSPSVSISVAGGNYGTSDCTQMAAFAANGASSGRGGMPVTGLSYVSTQEFPLPVRLHCFDLLPDGDQVKFKWTAYDEEDVIAYELEYRNMANDWSLKERLPAQSGNAAVKNYSLSLPLPKENTAYRIKAIASSGSGIFSCIRSFKPASTTVNFSSTGHSVQVSHPGQTITIELFNNMGQRVPLHIHRTANVSIFDKSQLPRGLYYLQICTANDRLVYAFTKL